MIVDMLMFRDLRRSYLQPELRRLFLQKLSILLSGRNKIVADEAMIYELIEDQFRNDLRRLQPDERRGKRDELYNDLRSSATLTRRDEATQGVAYFSHNSLREYLVSEYFVEKLIERKPAHITIPITPVMRSFVSSMSDNDKMSCWQAIQELWPQRNIQYQLGEYISLLWDVLIQSDKGLIGSLSDLRRERSGNIVFLNDISLRQVAFARSDDMGEVKFSFSNSELDSVKFDGIGLKNADFKHSLIDSVSFKGCDLSNADFAGAFIYECNVIGSNLSGADLSEVEADISIITLDADNKILRLTGKSAMGYMKFHGAKSKDIDDYYVYMHHKRFPIVIKILERLKDQRNNQLRGLTQRGEAHVDPPFARSFVSKLQSLGILTSERNGVVSTTPEGRAAISQFFAHQILPKGLEIFLDEGV